MTYIVKPEQSNVGELVSEVVIHSLSRVSEFSVASWLSCRALRERDLTVSEIGKVLGVEWVLSGTCSLQGDQVLINAELARSSSGEIVHSERLRENAADLLQSESAIGATLASIVADKVMASEAKRVIRHALPSLAGHTLFLGAVGLMHRSTAAEFERSRDALEHLAERHPRLHFTRPWLAQWYVLRTTRGLTSDSENDARRALDHTARALDVVPEDSFSVAMEGFIYCHLKRDVERAQSQLETAVKINPNEALAWLFQGTTLALSCRYEDAWISTQRALQLSPLDPQRYYYLSLAASAAYFAGHLADAETLASQSLQLNAIHPMSLRTLTLALVDLDHIDRARECAKRLRVLEPQLTIRSYLSRQMHAAPVRSHCAQNLRIAGIPEN